MVQKDIKEAQNNWLARLKLEEGWLSFVLLLFAFMIMVGSISGANWVDGTQILPLTGVVAYLVGFGLARTRFVPGLLAHSFMISVGMVLVGFQVFPYIDSPYQEWYYRLGSAVQRVARWCANLYTGRAGEDPLVGLVGLALLIWVTGYISAWILFRRHRAWASLMLPGAILLVNLSYNPPNGFNSFALFLGAALLLVVRFNVFRNEDRWRRLGLYFKPGMLRWTLGVGGLVAMGLLAISFVIPGNADTNPLRNLFQQFTAPIQSIQGGINSLFSAAGDGKDHRIGRLPVNYTNFAKSFTVGGPIKLSNNPLLQVRGDDPSYLQAAVMDEYDGRGWLASYQDAENNNSLVFPQLSLGAGQTLPSTPAKDRADNKLEVNPLQPNLNVIFTGGDGTSSSLDSILSFHWEKTTIRANISEIKAVDIGTPVNGQQRIVLVDNNTGKAIPPDLLPLVRLLRQAAGIDVPAFVQVNYTKSQNNWTISAKVMNSRGSLTPTISPTRNPDGTFTLLTQDYIITVPAFQDTGLKEGSAPPSNYQLKINISDRNDSRLSQQLTLITANPPANSFTFEFRPDANTGNNNNNRTDFEKTTLGQQIRTEIDRIAGEGNDTKLDYSLQNGKPNFFSYDGYQPNYDDLLAMNPVRIPNAGVSYTSIGLRFKGDPATLRQASTIARGRTTNTSSRFPDWVVSRYLQLPDTVPQRVKTLAQRLTNGLTNDYDKAKAIENYLRGLTYNENTDFTPQNRDVVDYFLFDSKQGYCVHFASAFTVMMRSVGIPTRLVTGLIGGEYDQATGTYLVRESASHAWPQVYFNSIGWVNFEPTPAYSNNIRPATQATIPATTLAPSATATPEPAAQTTAPGTTPEAAGVTPTPVPVNTAKTGLSYEIPAWIWIGLVLILAGAITFVGYRLWLSSQYYLPDESPRTIYGRLERIARRAGLRGRKDMTPYEFSSYLAYQIPAADDHVREIVNAYVIDRYNRTVGDVNTATVMATGTAMRLHWVAFVDELVNYRKQRALRRLTPGFLRGIFNRQEK